VNTPPRERLHPAVWPAALLVLISVGRLPELFPFLASMHLGKVAVLWAVVAVILGSRDVGNANVFDQRLGRLLVAWYVFAVASVVWSVWGSYSLGFVAGGLLSNMILFFVIARTTTNNRTLHFHAVTLLVAAAMLSVTAVRAALAGADGRIAVGAAYDPNDLAMILVMILPLAVALLFAARGGARIVLLGLCGSILVGILLTGSRGGFLGLVAVGGYLCCARLPRPDGGLGARFTPGKFATAGFAFILLALATPASVWERMATIASLEDDYNLTDPTGRIAIWTRGLEAMAERPWGYGVKAFESVEGDQGGRFKAAHNIWIEIGVELGVQGVVLLAMVLVTAFAIAGRVRRQPPRAPPEHWPLPVALGLRGALVGYLVTGFFLSAAYASVLFAMLGLFAGLQNLLAAPVPSTADTIADTAARTITEPPASPPSAGRSPARPTAPVGGWRPISGGRARRRTPVGRS
jgi:O-antigen ligase